MLKRKYILRFLAGILLVVAALFGWLEYKRSSQLTALVEMGFPVTPEAMLKYYPKVPDDENAWVLLDGLEKQFQYPEELMPNVPIVGDAEWGECGDNEPMPPEVLAASEALLALNAKQLETLHEACRRPYMRIPGKVTEEGYLDFENSYIEISDMRQFARMIILQGNTALENKDYTLATRDFVSGMHLARMQGQQPSTATPLVSYAILSMPLAMVLPILQANPSSDELLSELLKSLKEQEAQISLSQFYAMDLADNTLGFYKVLPANPNSANNFFNKLVLFEENWNEIIRYLEVPYHKFYMRYIFVFMRYDFLNELSTRSSDTKMQSINAGNATKDRFSHFPVTQDLPYMPSLNLSVIDTYFRYLSELRFWQVAVALKRFNLKYSHYPAALAELQPEFFDALPVVPVEDTNWEYTVDANGCKLRYTIDFFRREDLDITLLNQ